MLGMKLNTEAEGARAQKEAVLILIDGLKDSAADKDEIRAAIEFIVAPPAPGDGGLAHMKARGRLRTGAHPQNFFPAGNFGLPQAKSPQSGFLNKI